METMSEYCNRMLVLINGNIYRRTYKRGGFETHPILRSQNITTGRMYISFGGKTYIYSRILWIMHYGDIPDGMVVDHKDKDYLNDDIKNYRLLTEQQNQLNTNKILQAHNTSGYRGVRLKYPNRNKSWVYEIKLKGQKCIRESFCTALEAAKARDEYINKYKLMLVKNF
jgi:hypothetical protein